MLKIILLRYCIHRVDPYYSCRLSSPKDQKNLRFGCPDMCCNLMRFYSGVLFNDLSDFLDLFGSCDVPEGPPHQSNFSLVWIETPNERLANKRCIPAQTHSGAFCGHLLRFRFRRLKFWWTIDSRIVGCAQLPYHSIKLAINYRLRIFSMPSGYGYHVWGLWLIEI